MFKNILLTVDLEHADTWAKALPVALDAAKASERQAACHDGRAGGRRAGADAGGPLRLRGEAGAGGQGRARPVRARARAEPTSTAQQIVTYGGIYREILRVAAEIPADLIVMAAHRPQPGDFLIGSNAERVSRRARCTVMLVR